MYHEDLEKRGGLLGGSGRVAHERHKSHVSQKGDCLLCETPSQIFPLFKILVVLKLDFLRNCLETI